MPLINVEFVEGVFDSEQKQQIIERLTGCRPGASGVGGPFGGL